MKTKISSNNPFGFNRYGFLWERLNIAKPKVHLDYGAYDGRVLSLLKTTNVIENGVGVDLNEIIVSKSKNNLPNGVSLITCLSGKKLPFEDKCFDSISILDVIEHVSDQHSLLLEMNRLLTENGILVVTVPKKHLFSFLDTGNFKFRFPKLHRYFYQLSYSKASYYERYIECKNGLFGDIEIGKMWHQHFSEHDLDSLLNEAGFQTILFDGSGLFCRIYIGLGSILPFLNFILSKITRWDYKMFEHSNLYCIAKKIS